MSQFFLHCATSAIRETIAISMNLAAMQSKYKDHQFMLIQDVVNPGSQVSFNAMIRNNHYSRSKVLEFFILTRQKKGM